MEEKRPSVSVIIPNYNHEKYLTQRIETVLGQRYQDFEVIILDDCSSDGSREIIMKYAKHPKVEAVVFNEHNSGSPFKQWEFGIRQAKGDWIWIAESDDYAGEDFLVKLMCVAEANPDAGLIYCDAGIITNEVLQKETFAEVKNKIFQTDRWSHDYGNRGQSELEDYAFYESTINNTSSVLFNARVMKRMNPFDIELRYIGDKYAFVKILAFTDVFYVKECMNYYREPFNSRHATKAMFNTCEQFKVFDWVHRNMKQVNPVKFYAAFFASTSCSLFRNWNVEKIGIVAELFSVNSWLFWRWFFWNLKRPFVARINKMIFKTPL